MKDFKLLNEQAINEARCDFDELLIDMSQNDNIRSSDEADLYLQKKYFYHQEMKKLLNFINDIKTAYQLSDEQMHYKGIQEYLAPYKELLKDQKIVDAVKRMKTKHI